MQQIFRAYDIRGIYGKDLTNEIVNKIGKAFVSLVGAREVVVGRDIRRSSEEIQKHLVNGIISKGVDVVDIGIVPTPVLYFSIVSKKMDGGSIITGSHLPPEWNGIKLCREKGVSLTYETGIEKIKNMVLEESLSDSKEYGKIKKYNVLEEYVNYIVNTVRLNKKLKIILDFGNGTCGEVGEKIFGKLNLDVKLLYKEPDPTFPNHIPDPLKEETLTKLREEVVREKADFGIAFDGDGDRIGFVDDRGRVVRGDQAFMLFAKNVLSKNKDARFLFEVRGSRAVFEYVNQIGGKIDFVRVGHSYIMEGLKKENAFLAGELSGHFFFKENFGYDDGFFAAVKMVEILSNSDKKFSELVDSLPKYFSTPEIRIHYPDEKKFLLVERMIEIFKKEGFKMNLTDGARLEFDDGWALVRASNTEPAIVLRFEAVNETRLNEIKERILERVKQEAGKDGMKINL